MANKERVQLLVDALRSGEYRQGTGLLRTQGGSYCCLGVACEVFSKETSQGRWRRKTGESEWWFEVEGTSEVGVLPVVVRNWFGFNEVNPMLTAEVVASSANDGGWDFNKIADAFERMYIKRDRP